MNSSSHTNLFPFRAEIVDLIANADLADNFLAAFFSFSVFDDYVGETFHDVRGYFGVDV